MTYLGMPVWMGDAECGNLPPDLLDVPFGDSEDEEEQFDTVDSDTFVYSYCLQCPVVQQCAEYAGKNNITHGVWGGYNSAGKD